MIKKFRSRKSRFKDNILGADLAEIGSLSSFNLGVKYLLCGIDVFTKYAWIKALKEKKKLKQFFIVLLKQ